MVGHVINYKRSWGVKLDFVENCYILTLESVPQLSSALFHFESIKNQDKHVKDYKSVLFISLQDL